MEQTPRDGPFHVLAEIIRLCDDDITDRRAVMRGIVAETNKRAAIAQLAREGLVEADEARLVPTELGRSVVAAAERRGRAQAALLVGRWFRELEEALCAARGKGPKLQIIVETSDSGVIEMSLDDARHQKLVEPDRSMGFLRLPLGQVYRLTRAAVNFERGTEQERLRVRFTRVG